MNDKISLFSNFSGSKNKVSDLKIKTNKIYLPWVEKYRPSNLEDIILDDLTKRKMNNFLANNNVSNMIITGHPGTGKTSTILCLAKQIYQESFSQCVIEYNASDNRGLETINNSIIHFCRKKVSNKKNLPKLVILDEADNITKKAQNTLCNLMEIYDKSTKFVLTCNDYNKLVEGIQTRCLIIRYNSISSSYLKKKLIEICEKENIEYDDDGLKAITFICQGDIRLAINCLESTYFGFNKITHDNVYRICEKPSKFTAFIALRLIFSVNPGLLFKYYGYTYILTILKSSFCIEFNIASNNSFSSFTKSLNETLSNVRMFPF